MCGRCMKTCPWNLEGIFKERPFRWAAMNVPQLAPALAQLDDAVGNGSLNKVKKWWWDLEIQQDGGYRPTSTPVNRRDLQKDLKLDFKDQTLAVYPAPLAPHPYPYPFPMDREAGIAAHNALIPADEYRKRLAAGDHSVIHRTAPATDSPVIEVEVTEARQTAQNVMVYTLESVDRRPLPAWDAGAHLDIVVAPEYLRQYSLCGDPGDTSRYQIAVLREKQGRGGSDLMHRIFQTRRRVFVSHPINHFPLHPGAPFSALMGGGIGITPLVAMAHSLHRDGRDFVLHYSGRTRAGMGLLDEIKASPWADRLKLHVTDEGTRVDLFAVLAAFPAGTHVYTCGAPAYMESVMDAAEHAGIPDDARHLEYFAVPEQPDYVNHPFTLRLAKTGRLFEVPADKSAADVLIEHGYSIDLKCADGICGVCKCGLLGGNVEHRDFVLSRAQRDNNIILCQSRAAEANGEIEIDL